MLYYEIVFVLEDFWTMSKTVCEGVISKLQQETENLLNLDEYVTFIYFILDATVLVKMKRN